MEGGRRALVVFFLKSWLFMWDVLTFPMYALIYQKWNLDNVQDTEPRSKIVKHTDEEVQIEPKKITFPFLEVVKSADPPLDTVAKLFDYCVELHSTKPCLGTREAFAIEAEVQPDGRVFNKIIQGDYQWINYEQVDDISTNIAKGMLAIGMNPKEDKAIIYADTSANWLMNCIGCFKTGITLATLYTNLGDESVKFGINQTQAKTLIMSQEFLPKVKRYIDDLPHLEHIIYIPSRVKKTVDTKFSKVKLHSMEDIQRLGENAPSHIRLTPPKADDLAMIMYTSGSTGTPKGALLTHWTFTMAIKACMVRALDLAGEQRYADESFFAFLPIAHIFELSHEFVVLLMGVKIGYSGPNTLTDKSSMIKAGQKGDATVLKPTIMLGVPTILDRIYKAIHSNVQAKGKVFEAVFQKLYQYRLSWVKKGFGTPIINRLVFSKLKQSLGGRIELIISAGAPLSADVHEFIRTCLDVHIAQGYGLTETMGGVCLSDRSELETGQVGFPLPGVMMKLINWSEGGYSVRDPQGPRGEIVLGGPNVSTGYFDMPEKTAESFEVDQEGNQWFYTGDIGHLLPRGTIRIIDRKKDLVKLAMGEYVSLGKVEAAMKVHPVVDNICVYADSSKTFTIAIVVAEENNLAQFIQKHDSLVPMPFAAACKSSSVLSAVLESIQKHGSSSLEKFEIPRGLVLVSEPWTPESGLVTAALKIRRRQIQTEYQTDIDNLYAKMQ